MNLNTYKNKIKTTLLNLENKHDFILVYGGQTEKRLTERLKEHKKTKKYTNLKIRLIINFNKDDNDNKELIKQCETYLIKLLKDKYKNKCKNIQIGGGSGYNHQKGDKHKLYIIFK